jgi:hypothetical protein
MNILKGYYIFTAQFTGRRNRQAYAIASIAVSKIDNLNSGGNSGSVET